MSVYALMVTKDEEQRYLQSALLAVAQQVDGVFVYDDQSEDDTAKVAAEIADVVVVRGNSVPPFLEHEGHFRQGSLDSFARHMTPTDRDWVLGIDADEFMVSDRGDVREHLRWVTSSAGSAGAVSVRFHRPEVWWADYIGPGGDTWDEFRGESIRVDGNWNQIWCTRLFRWQPGGEIQKKSMGCGSEPTYVAQGKVFRDVDLKMLHYGYVYTGDLQEKYERYTSLLDHGHNDKHVQSIVDDPQLEQWGGPWPEVWRGYKP